MVGAGLSLNAEPLPGVNARFPTWRELARAMFDELHPSQPDQTPEQAQAREERFNSANPLRIASQYEAAFDRRKLDLLISTEIPDSGAPTRRASPLAAAASVGRCFHYQLRHAAGES